MANLYGSAFAPADGVRHCEQVQFDLFNEDRWPKHPYCTDDLESGIYPQSLSCAIKRKYIQPNPPHLRVWSVYDLDYSGAATAWEDEGLPSPSWAAINRDNGHAHLVYGLSAPVLIDSPDMRQAPLRYLCAVENAFRSKLNGDVSYSGLITKNPAHPIWRILRGNVEFYELSYLAEFVDLQKFIPKKNPELIGLGRNVTLFEELRQYAYKHIRRFNGQGLQGWNAWMSHMHITGLEINGYFPIPLDGREVWHICKSVAKWTYHKFDVKASDKRFSELQAHRGRNGGIKSGEARLLASEDKRASARLMKAQGLSYQKIADALGVSRRTVIYWCNEALIR